MVATQFPGADIESGQDEMPVERSGDDWTAVVCPLSGDRTAERALPTAFDLADVRRVPVHLVSVVEDRHEVGRRRTYLEQISARRMAEGADRPSVEVVVDPHAPRALAERADTSDHTIVMATSSQPLLHAGYLGSAAEQTVRAARHPALLVGPHNEVRLRDVERVVVPCDDSQLSESALPVGREWADLLGVDLWVVTVVDPHDVGRSGADPMMESSRVRRLANSVDASWEVLHGPDAANAIVQWSGPALITMTTHGRRGLSRLALGSVTTGVVRWAKGPVLAVNGTHRQR